MADKISWPDGELPIIPFDVFAAADFFLKTGRSVEDILPVLGLTDAQWRVLANVYGDFHFSVPNVHRDRYFGGRTDAEVLALVLPPRWRMPEADDEPSLAATNHIKRAVWKNPRIGPFAAVDWPAVHIATHPDMSLCFYSHDGRRIYFAGEPLSGRDGAPILPDVATFEQIGGRWLRDAERVYAQGQLGAANPKLYWYVVEGADRDSFTSLNPRYAKDKRQAYYVTGKTIRTKSPEAFEIVPETRLNYVSGRREPLHDASHFARDAEHVYSYGRRLRGADPAGFRDLGHDYLTDGQSVWHEASMMRRVEGADAASFIVPGPGEPHVRGRYGGSAVTDRLRPYDNGKVDERKGRAERWRSFFEFRTDLSGYWWHAEAER